MEAKMQRLMLVLLLALLVHCASARPRSRSPPRPRRVTFGEEIYWWEYPWADCAGANINATLNPGRPLQEYIANCLATQNCDGFNTNGQLKSCSFPRSVLLLIALVGQFPHVQLPASRTSRTSSQSYYI
eukprot:m.86468 g.86468  ORF g.86468 m.86468 type:complete len:129 (-) comp50921_c0_seq3:57-443(-)